MIKQATVVKTAYEKAMSKADKLVKEIEGGKDKSWNWARNEGNVGMLKAAIKKVIAEHDSFDNDFALLELKVIRNRYTDAKLHEGLSSFCKKLEFQKSCETHEDALHAACDGLTVAIFLSETRSCADNGTLSLR